MVFSLRDARDNASAFIGLSTAMLSAGLIHEEPRDLRRVPKSPRILELVCTFVDGTAARTWRRHPKLRSTLAELAPRLASGPRVRRYRDVIFDYDHVGTCRCAAPSWLVLDAPCLVEHGSPLVCGDCHERLPSYAIGSEVGCHSWAYVYARVYEIWIHSGTLEEWALGELRDRASETNKTAVRVARRTARHYGVAVLPRVFTEGDQALCPWCGRIGVTLGWRSLVHCRRCRIVY